MKKFKNLKLMLIGLLAMVGVNAFAADEYYFEDNLVYIRLDADVTAGKMQVYFMGLNKNITGEDPANDATKISVPGQITPRNTEGNMVTFDVVGVYSGGYYADKAWMIATSAGSQQTQSLTPGVLTELSFDKKVRLTNEQVQAIFNGDNTELSGLTKLTINNGRDVAELVGKAGKQPAFWYMIQKLNINGLSNDVDGVVKIADGLFAGSANLDEITLPTTPAGVEIGKNTFKATASLKVVDLSNVLKIGDNAFDGSALENLTIGTKTVAIGDGAFANGAGNKLGKVTITGGDDLTTIPAAFAGQDKITEVKISGKATSIASGAFADATAIQKIDLTGATEMATISGAFAPATTAPFALKEVLLKDTKIKGGLFAVAGITTLTKYEFPPLLEGALPSFNGCTALATITAIPEKVTSIPNDGFRYVGKLEAIDLSGAKELGSIGTYAFSEMAKLKEIDFSATKVSAIPEGAFKMKVTAQATEATGFTLYPDGKYRKFDTALKKVTLKDVTSVEGVTNFVIGKEAFAFTASLDEVVNLNQKKVKFAAATATHAFVCSGIKSVDFTKAVIKDDKGKFTATCLTEIPDQTFFMAVRLASVTLPEGINTIGVAAFKNCVSLTTLKDNGLTNLKTIGAQAFRNCDLNALNLKGATGKDDSGNWLFTTIFDGTFADNENLATVELPAQLSVIGDGAFSYAKALKSINLNQTSITWLPNLFTWDVDAPFGSESDNDDEISLDNLKTLALVKDPEILVDGDPLPEIWGIDDYALQFTGLVGTEEEPIVIPSEVSYLGDGVFQACVKLENVKWENSSYTSLPDDMFRGCTNLKNVWFQTTATVDPDGVRDKEVFFMCNIDNLTVYVTPDSYKILEANGLGNENRVYSKIEPLGNKVFQFKDSNLNKKDNKYYATYYSMTNSSWFPADKFEVYTAVVKGSKVELEPATAVDGYYKVAQFTDDKDDNYGKKSICIVVSADKEALPELHSNDGSQHISTLPKDNHLKFSYGLPSDKGSKKNYVYKLGSKSGVIAFYRIVSGNFDFGKIYINAEEAAARGIDALYFNDETTGINAVENVENDNAPVYNLQGVRVNNAQKGVFIKNGKKFVK